MQIRRRKIFLSAVLFLLVLVQAVCLALEEDIALSAFNQFFALYMLAVAGFSIANPCPFTWNLCGT
jgi:hypothetical protein